MKILINKQQTPIKNRLSTLVLLALLGLGSSLVVSQTQPLASAQSQSLDQILVIVDDDVVLASEMEQRLKQILINIKKSGKTGPPMDELQQEVLNQLILENIQLQMADRAGVRINDAQLNESLQRIAQQNGLGLEQFKQALERDGTSYIATREQVRIEMMLQRVQQGNVNQRVQISAQEINNFLDSEEGQAMTSPEYHMLHTLIPLPSNANDATILAAKQQADALYQRIQAGEAYEIVLTSSKKNKLSINDIGWRKAGDLPSLMSNLTSTLEEGKTAAPIKSASGFHLIKLLKKRGDGEVITQTRARHILLKASAIRDEAATKKTIDDLRQSIIDGEDFTDLAREHSEDIGSAVEGGDLGWTSPGQLVAIFQDNMDATAIDKMSPAFRSNYGWHILEVLERREKDVTENIRQNAARNFIHKRKYDDELQAWLQKIRDEAYVDFKQ
jgi:peptidyl-prolyl cis-trans isomerase SurA